MIGNIAWAIAHMTYTMEYIADVGKIVAAITMNLQPFLTTSSNIIFLARHEYFLRLNEALERVALNGEFKSIFIQLYYTKGLILLLNSSNILLFLTTALI